MKRVVFLACLLVLAVAPLASMASFNSFNHEPAAGRIELTIDFGNGTTEEYSNVHGETVLDVTQNATSVDVDWYGDQAFVTAIAGVANNAESGLWWQYWVNGELGSVAANKYQLRTNDTVAWRRIPPSYNASNGDTTDSSTLIALILLPVIGIIAISIIYVRRKGK